MGRVRYLVLQPTRELAAQCHSMLVQLSKHLGNQFTSVAVFGGSSIVKQRHEMSSCPDFIVATTGRLLDHVQNT